MAVSGKCEPIQTIYLKWSAPKTAKVELQYCSSVYRVTPTDVGWLMMTSVPQISVCWCCACWLVSQVTSRPTICLVNFVLSGKPVVLEQPKKGNSKVVSHVLISHGGQPGPYSLFLVGQDKVMCDCCFGCSVGAIFLHCLPSGRTYLDDPPSISEGWGGRITDYRISVWVQFYCGSHWWSALFHLGHV